jgi:hypothetical protein
MLQQISSGKIFDSDDIFLAPLNDYVFHAGKRFADWFMEGKLHTENRGDPLTLFFSPFSNGC